MNASAAAASRVDAACAALDAVPDPEVPVLSVRDLGIVREVLDHGDGSMEVVLTPTYSGCPATEVIADSVREALVAAGLPTLSSGPHRSRSRGSSSPPWTQASSRKIRLGAAR